MTMKSSKEIAEILLNLQKISREYEEGSMERKLIKAQINTISCILDEKFDAKLWLEDMRGSG